MFKKIAQWIRTRQERRLREKLVMRWNYERFSDPNIIEVADKTIKFILTGELPPPYQDNRG